MCGIAGIVGPQAHERAAAAMIEAIAHRGPDGSSVLQGHHHALAHARLAIIDIDTGAQPMRSRSGRWLIVFNGEIYNYKAIRADLRDVYPFVTQSDTEAILAAVECHGVEHALSMIDGMFALALIDTQQQALHLARDHFGIKPLYWTVPHEGGLAFASELKAFRALGLRAALDTTALVTQLMCRFIPAPHTGHEGVHKLRPGQWLQFDLQGRLLAEQRIRPLSARTAADAGGIEATADLLQAAVRAQLVSDVPIGTLLSGGIDSALVTRYAVGEQSGLHTFCVGYGPEHAATEFAQATETANLLRTVHHNITVEEGDFADAVSDAIWHLEEPVATTSLVSYSLLCKAVVAQRKVVLTGQGADEPWAGYSRHRFEALLATRGPALRLGAPLLSSLAGNRPRLREILGHLADEALRWVAYRSLFPLQQMREVFGNARVDDALSRIDQALTWADGQLPSAAQDPFSRLLVRDSYTDLSDNLLLLADKLSMAHGLEVRVPMLDVAYATHVAHLPLQAKRRGSLMQEGKAMHKEVAMRCLPPAIVHRRKKGFETPLKDWFAGELGRRVRDQVLSAQSPLAQALPAAELLGARADSGKVNHELQQQLFSLWITDEWMRKFR